MIETIYIARHGFRLNWVTNQWRSPTGTPRDPPISAYGEKQAAELAQYFTSLPVHARPTAIFSSPYYRCLQTCRPIAVALGLPVYVENGLSEWYSPVTPGTGLHPIPAPTASLAARFPALRIDADVWPTPTWVPSRRGETIAEVHDRCKGFLVAFVPRVESLAGGVHSRILLVSHAATVAALTRGLVGDANLPMRVACCSLTTVARRPKQAAQTVGVWELRGLARGDFLSGGLERDWGFEDVEVQVGKVVEDPGVPGTEEETEGDYGLQLIARCARI